MTVAISVLPSQPLHASSRATRELLIRMHVLKKAQASLDAALEQLNHNPKMQLRTLLAVVVAADVALGQVLKAERRAASAGSRRPDAPKVDDGRRRKTR